MTTGKPTPPTPASPNSEGALKDALGRALRDLRISVTDRCNFRCTYCMPKDVFGRDHPFLERGEILTFEEIARLAAVFARAGARKLRLTGGEPTMRRGLPRLVEMLAAIEGVEDLAMTTNGSRLADLAAGLRAAGLKRLTVSLDSLDDAVFRSMNDVDFPVTRVLKGMDAALAAGFSPLKINVVVKRGVNDHTILDFARHFRGPHYIVRFIEFMDVGRSNGWRLDDVAPGAGIVQTIAREFPLEPIEPEYPGEVANRWRYADGSGEIGVIASVTQPFCAGCTRARLSADGKLYTCLFGIAGHDFRSLLRAGATDDDLEAFLRALWSRRKDRYSEQRSARTPGLDKVEMSYIGG